jgi:hypothetical protein
MRSGKKRGGIIPASSAFRFLLGQPDKSTGLSELY